MLIDLGTIGLGLLCLIALFRLWTRQTGVRVVLVVQSLAPIGFVLAGVIRLAFVIGIANFGGPARLGNDVFTRMLGWSFVFVGLASLLLLEFAVRRSVGKYVKGSLAVQVMLGLAIALLPRSYIPLGIGAVYAFFGWMFFLSTLRTEGM